MGNIKNNHSHPGKYPEEVQPFESHMIMQDDKFLLMQQCIRDARELHIMVRHFTGTDAIYLESWKQYEHDVLLLAQSLFRERVENPITHETMKRVMLAGDSATQELEKINIYHEELLDLTRNIGEMRERQNVIREEINVKEQAIVELKSQEFLISSIGEANASILELKGAINLVGTNGAKYRITDSGYIYKTVTKKRFLRGSEEVQEGFGKIQKTGGLPMKDAIATIYMHITRDSDRFDKDKRCGAITIRS